MIDNDVNIPDKLLLNAPTLKLEFIAGRYKVSKRYKNTFTCIYLELDEARELVRELHRSIPDVLSSELVKEFWE